MKRIGDIPPNGPDCVKDLGPMDGRNSRTLIELVV
jgi:hypothetical protein